MIFVCFAAYNEELNIENLLVRIAAHFPAADSYKVVAYNDGSTDNTYGELKRFESRYPLVILHNDVNKGLGAGTAALIDYACQHGADDDVAVFMDGDDTHDPSVIRLMMEAINGGADVVIASRYCKGSKVSGIPWQRDIISRMASLFWRIMLPVKHVKDFTCGFRAYRIGTLKKALAAKGGVLITRRGFECQVELLSGLRPYARFAEVPIHLAYDRKLGASKMRLARTIFKTVSLGMYLLKQRVLG